MAIDPMQFITYKLYREHTKFLNGHHVKDLSCLNRDLSKVILVDIYPESTRLNPENTLIIKRWVNDSDSDNVLPELETFLSGLAC